MLFLIRVEDITKISKNSFWSKYRLTDFDVNYQFDTHNFGKEYNLTDILQ